MSDDIEEEAMAVIANGNARKQLHTLMDYYHRVYNEMKNESSIDVINERFGKHIFESLSAAIYIAMREFEDEETKTNIQHIMLTEVIAMPLALAVADLVALNKESEDVAI